VNIERVPISKVVPWDKNPRGIKTKDFERLKKQILKLGTYKPLLAYRENGGYVVLGGNMRIRAYKELGIQEVDISVIDAPTEAKKIEYALSDNDRVGYYEEEALAELIYPHIKDIDLGEFKVDIGEPIDLKQVVERYGPDIDDGADEVPEVDDTPALTKAGDLFTLGRHRVMCGDSTKAEDVALLMRGEKADMVFTDPPYGMNLDTDYTKMPNDKVKPRSYRSVVGDDSPFMFAEFSWIDCQEQFWWGADYYCQDLPGGGSWFVWDKRVEANDAFIGSGFELCWSKSPHKRKVLRYNWCGYTAHDAGEHRSHPTQKPIKMFAELLRDYAKDGWLILDPFLGSGTTLIAAEKLNRTCYGMEIDCRYVDVIVTRYCQFVGTDKVIRNDEEITWPLK